jgi:SAM-dependent methyltransferase
VGQLPDLDLPDASFDAIVMNHVIEHIHDPRALLAECMRLLKKGGWLVATTPNARSTGLRQFGEHWRGLEVPRHLYLFTPEALDSAAESAGFQSARVWTTAARSAGMVQASLEIRDQGQHRMGSQPGFTGSVAKALLLYQPAFLIQNLFNPSVGEECVLKAIK